MSRLVIGLVGRKVSGKGTVAKILKEKYGASLYKFSDVLRDIAKILSIENSRENLIQLSIILRKEFGEDVLKNALLKRLENDGSQFIVLDGLRRLGDLDGLDQLGNFHLVFVSAPLETRYARATQRGENAGEQTRTLESFREMENAPTEITIADLGQRADQTIDNSGTPEELAEQVDEMMQKLR